METTNTYYLNNIEVAKVTNNNGKLSAKFIPPFSLFLWVVGKDTILEPENDEDKFGIETVKDLLELADVK